MSVNITINVMGTKDDVQKLWDALSQPNEYGGGTGIKLDHDSIHPIEGTEFPLWEAKGEMDNMPEEDPSEFEYLYADFPTLSICLRIFSDDGDRVSYGGVNGYCNMHTTSINRNYKQKVNIDKFESDNFFFYIWKTLKYVPDSITKTEGMCLEAVKMFGYSREFEYIPDGFKTAELCLEAVKQDGRTLQFVPEVLRTAELCLEAVRSNGEALLFVPDEHKTLEMCHAAVKQDGKAVAYVLEELKTAELCLKAVKGDGRALEYVPEELRTMDLCLMAVKEFSWALKYVPEELKTEELCLEALHQDGNVIKYVPEKIKASELCFEAVEQNGNELQFLSSEERASLQKDIVKGLRSHLK
jgi:hypothetical protein